jgi:hypothetical protein
VGEVQGRSRTRQHRAKSRGEGSASWVRFKEGAELGSIEPKKTATVGALSTIDTPSLPMVFAKMSLVVKQ